MEFKRCTPYFHKHAALNAEFADRIGYAAAVNFGSVEVEHQAARTLSAFSTSIPNISSRSRGRMPWT